MVGGREGGGWMVGEREMVEVERKRKDDENQ